MSSIFSELLIIGEMKKIELKYFPTSFQYT